MNTFLLILIAVGVLFMSKKGQDLLRVLVIFAAVACGIYLVYWLLMFLIVFIKQIEGLIPVLLIMTPLGLILWFLDKRFKILEGNKPALFISGFTLICLVIIGIILAFGN